MIRRTLWVTLSIVCAVAFTYGQDSRRERGYIPWPEPMQFIDRILRPCASGATPYVSAIAASDGDLDLTTCAGRSVTINGTPVNPSGGLADPGSNGLVVRTALNTTIARTLVQGTGMSVTNGTGVAGNPTVTLADTPVTPGSYTNTNLTVDQQGRITVAANGSSGGGSIGTGNVNMTVPNEAVTGTIANRLAKLTGAPSTVIRTATSDTENAVGVCTANCGTAGSATVAIMGQVSCEFDGGTTAGDYVVISSVTAGMCHDGGSVFPTSGAAYGRVLSTNAGAGTYTIELMTPDIAFQNAGNGKSRPGGSNLDYQFNGTGNVFAGGRLKQENTNIVSVNGGLNTPQTFKVYKTDNGAGTTQFLQFADDGSSRFEILSSAAGAAAQNLVLRVAGGGTGMTLGTGALVPTTDRGLDLGSGTNRWNQLFGFTAIVDAGSNYAMQNRGRIASPADGIIRVENSAGSLGFLFEEGRAFTSAQFDKTNATLANVTGLVTPGNLLAGKTYSFETYLFVDADATGGSKYAIAGTVTATAVKYEIVMICDASGLFVITSRQTALGGNAGQAGCTAGLTRITGAITVNAAGTLAVQFAQNAASGTSSVLTMSKLEVRLLN